jgi:hypothetical protein
MGLDDQELFALEARVLEIRAAATADQLTVAAVAVGDSRQQQ